MHIMPLVSTVLTYINKFQEVICYLVNANFLLAKHVTTGMLLSLLSCDPNHPDYFTKSTKVDTTTALASIVSQILEEKCQQMAKSSGDTSKTTLAI